MKEIVNKPFSQFETVILNDGVDFPEPAIEEPISEEPITEDPICHLCLDSMILIEKYNKYN